MKIIKTHELLTEPDFAALSKDELNWVYNGLDCCITSEILTQLSAQLDEVTTPLYEHTLRMQAPILDMMVRGIHVNTDHRKRAVQNTEADITRLQKQLDRLCVEGLGMREGVNPGSPTQVKDLFYKTLNLKVIKKRNQAGIYAPSSNRDTLEELNQYFIAQPFVSHILALRDKRKILGFLNTELDKDQRIRCSLNLAGTNTGRLSSSFSDYGTGTNLQNIDRNLRYIFTADPGKILVNVDLEQADSRNVGALCWQHFYESHGAEFAGSYLDACESSDLHTTVCKMCWTELDWAEESAANRAIADQIAYRTYSYRDLAKKQGHGTNYYGQPFQMAMQTKLPVKQVETFQSKYFGAFPCIPAWHEKTINLLQTTGQLTHLFGRRRYFFERHDDQSTINAAIAFCPQGMTGEEINHGILNLFQIPEVELLIQVHDSILFQVPWEKVNELVPQTLEAMKVTLPLIGGRDFTVPLDAETGYNWGKASKDGGNPFGLKTFTGEELRRPPKGMRAKKFSFEDI